MKSPIILFATAIRHLKIYENGKYCIFLRAIGLLNRPYSDIFTTLTSYRKLGNYLSPFVGAWKGGAVEQLQGQIANAKVPLSRVINPLPYWIMSGNGFMLDINNPDAPKVLCMGNSPNRQNIYPAALGLYNVRVVKMMSRKRKLRCSVLVGEVPMAYFRGLDTLIATVRSNKVAVCLDAQGFSQLVRDYGEKEARVVQGTVDNVFAGQVLGEAAKNLSERFGKVLQQRKSVNITHEDTSIGISTQLDSLVPASKISNLSQSMSMGSVCDSFQEKMEQKIFCCEIVVNSARVATETKIYKSIPAVTDSTDRDGKDHMREEIERNYYRIKKEVGGIVQKELRRIGNDLNLEHLLEAENDGQQ